MTSCVLIFFSIFLLNNDFDPSKTEVTEYVMAESMINSNPAKLWLCRHNPVDVNKKIIKESQV